MKMLLIETMDEVKEVIRGKFIVLYPYIRKKAENQFNMHEISLKANAKLTPKRRK